MGHVENDLCALRVGEQKLWAGRGEADSVISCCSLVKVVNRGQLVMPLGSAAALTHRPASGTAVTTAAVVRQPARWYHL